MQEVHAGERRRGEWCTQQGSGVMRRAGSVGTFSCLPLNVASGRLLGCIESAMMRANVGCANTGVPSSILQILTFPGSITGRTLRAASARYRKMLPSWPEEKPASKCSTF